MWTSSWRDFTQEVPWWDWFEYLQSLFIYYTLFSHCPTGVITSAAKACNFSHVICTTSCSIMLCMHADDAIEATEMPALLSTFSGFGRTKIWSNSGTIKKQIIGSWLECSCQVMDAFGKLLSTKDLDLHKATWLLCFPRAWQSLMHIHNSMVAVGNHKPTILLLFTFSFSLQYYQYRKTFKEVLKEERVLDEARKRQAMHTTKLNRLQKQVWKQCRHVALPFSSTVWHT